MADVFTKRKRSDIMSRIKSRNTKLEIDFLKLLSSSLYPMGYRYRKHYSRLIGKPDIVFVRNKIAVFLDGDFWHGYNFRKTGSRLPKGYWRDKIRKNMLRDRVVNNRLKSDGWTIVRLWEHDIKRDPKTCLQKIITLLGRS